MYDTLLFLHVFAGFMLFVTVVMFSAYALGAPINAGGFRLANLLWDIGGLATLVFGVWLALYVDGYGIFDGWVLIALVLWLAATGVGIRARMQLVPAVEAGADIRATTDAAQVAIVHWTRTVIVLLLLLDMIYKPGA